MTELDNLGQLISTDLLIVGGGLSGLVAAIKAKEAKQDVDVLIVEKQTSGYSGKAPKGGGFFVVFTPDDDIDKFVEYHVKNIGIFLEDQELLQLYANESYHAVEQLSNWGVNVVKRADGKLDSNKNEFNGLWSYVGADADIELRLRARARKLGVKIMNKIQIVDLLKNNNDVAGAVGFNIIDGNFYIFNAKATLLANGSCNYHMRKMWAAGTGDGIAAAFRAGAEMRNAEFGNSCVDAIMRDNESHGHRRLLFNSLGENIAERYEPVEGPDMPIELVLGIEKEVLAGRGPIVEDTSKEDKSVRPRASMFARVELWNRPYWSALRQSERGKILKYEPSHLATPEVIMIVHGELAPIKVDHDMKTSLRGLWATGDTSWAGSAWTGAISPPAKMRGTGLLNAILSAMRGGPSAALFATREPLLKINPADVKRFKEEIFAPLKRKSGLDPNVSISGIQDVIRPIRYSVRRSKERLEEALSKIAQVQQGLPKLGAKDTHGLCKCHEAVSMTTCAEMSFKAALTRTESRGFHYREDYPKRDDKNWLKWVIVKYEGGKVQTSTQPIPIDKYKVKPY